MAELEQEYEEKVPEKAVVRRRIRVRHNIFDSIPSDIVSRKDNVFANFCKRLDFMSP
ncbi:MAG: hypothetical protein ACLTER_24340 [Ruminococcus sp.]